jgi:hypothetical protein
MIKQVLILIAVSIITISATAQKAEIFQKNGVAIRGYDPVAFFTLGEPVLGDSMISYIWKEATWNFSTKSNMEMFKADPEKFAPQYGGYCAYGTADGHKAPTEIDTWTVINGRLYFNYNKKVKEIWSKKTDYYILQADKNWERIRNQE